MKIYRKVLSHDSGQWILCAWDECERQGYELYKARVNERQHIIQYIFCSERHKMYWVNSHIKFGKVPDGYAHLV